MALARSSSVTGRITSSTLPLSSLSLMTENSSLCFFASFLNCLYCSGVMGNRRRSRVSRSILPMLTLPERTLRLLASAMVRASIFFRAEPDSRTITSVPESIMRTI